MSQLPFPQDRSPSRTRSSKSWRYITTSLLPRSRPWRASSSHTTTTTTALDADKIEEPIELSSPRSRSRLTPLWSRHGSFRSRSMPNPSLLPCSRNFSALWLPEDEDDPPADLFSEPASPPDSQPRLDLPRSAAAATTPQCTSGNVPCLHALPNALPYSSIPFHREEASSHESCDCLLSASTGSIWHEICHQDVPNHKSTSVSLPRSSSVSRPAPPSLTRSHSPSCSPSHSLNFSIISALIPNTSWESLLIPSPTHYDTPLIPSPSHTFPPPPPSPPSLLSLSPSRLPPSQQPKTSPTPPHFQPIISIQPIASIPDGRRSSASTPSPQMHSEDDDSGAEDGAEGGSSQEMGHWTVCGGVWFREGLGSGDWEGGEAGAGPGGGLVGGEGGGDGAEDARVREGEGIEVAPSVTVTVDEDAEGPCALGCCSVANRDGGAGSRIHRNSGGGCGAMATTSQPGIALPQDLIAEGARMERRQCSRYDEQIFGDGDGHADTYGKEDGDEGGSSRATSPTTSGPCLRSDHDTDDDDGEGLWRAVSREVVAHHFDEESGRYVSCNA